MRHLIVQFQFNLPWFVSLLTSLSGTTLLAQFNQNPIHLMSPEHEMEASRLREGAPQQI